MFLLTFRHALRSREARQLKIADVDMENLTITIRCVKGSRSGVQPLERHKSEPTLEEVVRLKAWLKERVEDGSQILFPSQKGGMMTRMQFLRLARRLSDWLIYTPPPPHRVWQKRPEDGRRLGVQIQCGKNRMSEHRRKLRPIPS